MKPVPELDFHELKGRPYGHKIMRMRSQVIMLGGKKR
jgi:hypothetical protein